MRSVLAEKGYRFFSSSAVTQQNYKKIFDLAIEKTIKARAVPRRKRKEMNDSGNCSLIWFSLLRALLILSIDKNRWDFMEYGDHINDENDLHV